MKISEKTKRLFWAKVTVRDADECWLWGNSTMNSGYGNFWSPSHGRPVGARQMSFMIEVGAIPEGLCVLHNCDNKLCCNPAHLRLGTKKENTADMFKRGRNPDLKGEKNHSKLTDEKVMDLRRRWADGESQYSLGRAFGINPSTAYRIASGQRWTHLPVIARH